MNDDTVKTGRPEIVLTDEQLVEISALAAVLSQQQIADYLGIGRTTFHEIMKRQEGVSEHYKKGRARAVAGIAQGLIKKALDGDTTSAIFYLKTQAGWKETTGIDHQSSDGSMSPKGLSDFYAQLEDDEQEQESQEKSIADD